MGDNEISKDAAQYLSQMLLVNKTLTTLNIRNTKAMASNKNRGKSNCR
jgi:hypothetical protein